MRSLRARVSYPYFQRSKLRKVSCHDFATVMDTVPNWNQRPRAQSRNAPATSNPPKSKGGLSRLLRNSSRPFTRQYSDFYASLDATRRRDWHARFFSILGRSPLPNASARIEQTHAPSAKSSSARDTPHRDRKDRAPTQAEAAGGGPLVHRLVPWIERATPLQRQQQQVDDGSWGPALRLGRQS